MTSVIKSICLAVKPFAHGRGYLMIPFVLFLIVLSVVMIVSKFVAPLAPFVYSLF